jgi:hypothetical protein
MTVDQARKGAQHIKGQLAVGENPLEKKEKQAKEKTFGEAYQEYIERYVQAECKQSSLEDVEKRLKKILPFLSKRSLSSITKQEIRDIHGRIGRENGKVEASTVIYARLSNDPVRSSLEAAFDFSHKM